MIAVYAVWSWSPTWSIHHKKILSRLWVSFVFQSTDSFDCKPQNRIEMTPLNVFESKADIEFWGLNRT